MGVKYELDIDEKRLLAIAASTIAYLREEGYGSDSEKLTKKIAEQLYYYYQEARDCYNEV